VRDAAVYLRHIQDAVARIEAYTARGRTAFFTDTMVQDAVIRNLDVIGEAVKNLPPRPATSTPRDPLAQHHRSP